MATIADRPGDIFRLQFRNWVRSACEDWHLNPPNEDFYMEAWARLSDEVMDWVGYGLKTQIIQPDGYQFMVADALAKKGPYRWFSHRTWLSVPHCNWEYYIQLAYFAKLYEPCKKAGLRVAIEDSSMDIAVWEGNRLLWCIETKETRAQAANLLTDIEKWGLLSVDRSIADRGVDGLRKAKYLLNGRPTYFSIVAKDFERHFTVVYESDGRFRLNAAQAPVPSLVGAAIAGIEKDSSYAAAPVGTQLITQEAKPRSSTSRRAAKLVQTQTISCDDIADVLQNWSLDDPDILNSSSWHTYLEPVTRPFMNHIKASIERQEWAESVQIKAASNYFY